MKTRLKLIRKIFSVIKELGLQKNTKYYYSDLFDRFYDMEIDELQQYQYDMENERQFRTEECLTFKSKNHASD